MLRLRGNVSGRAVSLVLRDGKHLVGSSAACEIRLEHPSVSRQHAEIVVRGESARLRDSASRNGTFLGDQRVSEAQLVAGSALAFGRVELAIEEVDESDATEALAIPTGGAAQARGGKADLSTIGTRAADTFASDRLPALLELLASGCGAQRMALAAGAAFAELLPGAAIEITQGESAVLFRSHDQSAAGPAELAARRASCAVRGSFLTARAARLFSPMLEAVASLVEIASQREPRTRISAAAKPEGPPPPPEPASVVASVRRIYAEAAQVARGDVSVLICGESGTGKEVLARYIHAASPRASERFVALNCAALPRDLLEAELFGIERGVATGVEARAGKFELADGGTLFLDEIGDMAKETQASILRVLQEGEVFRIGSPVARPARVRILGATNKSVEKMLAAGEFREDLYYRIATWVVELPPLRERRADIAGLASFFLAREAARHQLAVKGISRAALDALTSRSWRGNIRQLEKEIARAVLFLGGSELLDLQALGPQPLEPAQTTGGTLAERLEQTERNEIARALRQAQGDVEEAAQRLGLGRSTLYRRMKELAIEEEKP